jgi:hypothetical protein
MTIIAFWLVTTGWFIVHAFGPVWRPDEAPPYTIELADEALRQIVPDRWTFSINGQKAGVVKTGLTYHAEDDTFELSATGVDLEFVKIGSITVKAARFSDRVRVTRDGELRAMRLAVVPVVSGLGPDLKGKFEVWGRVDGGAFDRHVRFVAAGIDPFEPNLPPTKPPRGSVLNPMHPVPRISGIRFGQTWRQPLTDPRADIVRAALAEWLPGHPPMLPEPPAALDARVLPDARPLEWNNEAHPCYVIEYTGSEDYVARTWVRISDGVVLRQVAGVHGEQVVLQRE